MNVTVLKSNPCGELNAPPSKSMVHRLLILASLSGGTSVIDNVDLSEDILATLDCLKALGTEIKVTGRRVTVHGTGGNIKPEGILNCRESGSTLRFMIPLCLRSGSSAILTGSPRLLSRPLDAYKSFAAEYGCSVESENGIIKVSGSLLSDNYSIDGSSSSQFVSGLLMALSGRDAVVTINGSGESMPYIDMTIAAMKMFGLDAERNGDIVKISGNLKPQRITAEGDYSNAAFIDALNYVSDGNAVKVTGLNDSSCQGDRIYKKYFEEILNGCPELDIRDCPDLAPILLALGAYNNGLVLNNTARLKLKESDRGQAMKEELSKFGAKVEVEENRITVKKSVLHSPDEFLESHNDHRIVMALTVLLTAFGGSIRNAEAVNKSYPGFFGDIEKLGVSIK